MSAKLLAFLDMLHDQSLELLRNLTFDKQFEKDGLIVCLYASMVELAGAIAMLSGKDRWTALSAVFRTFLEAYVDFRNVLIDPTYIKNCYARHHASWIKVLRESAEPNPYLARIHSHAEREATLKRHETEMQRLKDGGFQPLHVSTRFERVGMTKEYHSIYLFESDGTHNSLQALINRHVELGENDIGLALYKERSLDDYLIYLDSTAGLLMDATRQIHERLKSDHNKEIQTLSEQLTALRVSYSAKQQVSEAGSKSALGFRA